MQELVVFVAPGGSLQQDAGSESSVTRCVVCVFSAADEPAVLKSYYEVTALSCYILMPVVWLIGGLSLSFCSFAQHFFILPGQIISFHSLLSPLLVFFLHLLFNSVFVVV